MSEATPPLPNTLPWCGAQLKHRDNFNEITAFRSVAATFSYVYPIQDSNKTVKMNTAPQTDALLQHLFQS
jgi:hypothetical protein